MALALSAIRAPLSKVNFHLFGGIALGVTLFTILLLITFFGSDKSARPVVRLAIPSLTEAAQVQANLRGEDGGNTAQQHLNLHWDQQNPTLPGVHEPGDHAAPAHEQSASQSQHSASFAPANKNALKPAPFAGMTAPGPGGPLPVIGPNGMKVSQAYARPFHPQGNKPVIAMVVGGLGLMQSITNQAIEELPPEVTLSFVPYTPDLQKWINKARSYGHEVMVELPMEPFGYPDTDPGPQTLLSSASSAENTRRLEWLLSRATGYFAVTNYMGSKLTASQTALTPIMRGLRKRGVAFIYDGETRRSTLRDVAKSQALDWTTADRIVDAKRTSSDIDNQLLRLEALAIQNKNAIGMGFSWPITIQQIKEWAGTLPAKGYHLAPASAVLAMRQQDQNVVQTAANDSHADSAGHH